MTQIKSQKAQLRKLFRAERAERFAISQLNSRSTSQTLFLHLLESPEIKKSKCVTSYFSINDEPSTLYLNRALISAGKTVLLPRVFGRTLEWVKWDGKKTSLAEQRGLLEPAGPAIADFSIIDAVIVPTLAMDFQGYRLGQGGGFYDRSLPNMPGWRVGLIYENEISDEPLPHENHDMKLDAAATANTLIRFS